MQRKTKIVATLGPACDDLATLSQLFHAGVDVVRLNFSHGSAESHLARAQQVRQIAQQLQRPIAILCDCQGPKIRIGRFADHAVTLMNGAVFCLDAECRLGDAHNVGLDYADLPKEVQAGMLLLLDDGRIQLRVTSVQGAKIHCVVEHGGVLSNHKGINVQGGGLAAPALTAKDRADIVTAVALGADYVAISFVKDANDVHQARQLIQEAGGHAQVVAKIERAEAIPRLAEIIDASDAIMVARGDLGVEVGDAQVPGLQKQMIQLARARNKVVITATQMMESMITQPIPTRAEVSDVANAVLDGTDAVMLSAETAVGNYPLATVQAVHRVCVAAEQTAMPDTGAASVEAETIWQAQRHATFQPSLASITHTDEAIAKAAMYIANLYTIKAIVTFTQSGNTARWLSRSPAKVPIIALSPYAEVCQQLALLRNVYAMPLAHAASASEMLAAMQTLLLAHAVVAIGDTVLVTFGQPAAVVNGTNTLNLYTIGASLGRP